MLAAVEDLQARFPDLDLIFIASGGDKLAATFSPELADLTRYVIDVADFRAPAWVALHRCGANDAARSALGAPDWSYPCWHGPCQSV